VSREPACWAHATAVVDAGATIGAGTKIWHFCHVMAGARVGARCVLGQNVFVASGAVVGDGCRLQNNVSIYAGVALDDDVFVGPSAVFTNVRTPRAAVSRKDAFVPTRVGRGATIGANATIVCGVTIGGHAFVGAGAVVTRDVAPHAVVTGVPARRRGWACACGEVLRGRAGGRAWRCHACGSAWTVRGRGVEATLARVEAAQKARPPTKKISSRRRTPR
jgi:UDP-2-acetamido-3-amino-2,3-dideoxy-glucuronate N-acetyltransferase